MQTMTLARSRHSHGGGLLTYNTCQRIHQDTTMLPLSVLPGRSRTCAAALLITTSLLLGGCKAGDGEAMAAEDKEFGDCSAGGNYQRGSSRGRCQLYRHRVTMDALNNSSMRIRSTIQATAAMRKRLIFISKDRRVRAKF